jgi:prevent-host-death family protein
MASPIFTISTARQKFFSLFRAVTGHRGRKVVITSRGSENHAVLVDEAYLNDLEAAAKRLRDLESGNGKPASNPKTTPTKASAPSIFRLSLWLNSAKPVTGIV